MAIQLIDTATPQVGLKGGAEKLNANFTDTENAASRLVQSSPTDATAGKLMAVGAFGLGGSYTSTETDLDLYPVGSLGVTTPSSGMINGPSGAVYRATVDTLGNASGLFVSQKLIDDTGAIFERSKRISTWSAWKRIEPQAFGLGVDIDSVSVDPDTITHSGKYYYYGNLTTGAKSWNIEHNAGNTASQATQTAMAHGSGVPTNSNEYIIRHKDGGVWEPWQPVYTGANYQPDDYQGLNVVKLCRNLSGSAIVAGGTTGSATLRVAVATSAGVIQQGALLGGDWENVSGTTVNNNDYGLFRRYQ